AINDSLNSIEKQTQYQNLNVKFETEKKQKTINSLEKEKKLSDQVLDAQKRTNYVLSISLAVLILLSVGLFYVLSLNRKKSRSLLLLNNVKDKIFTVLSHDLRAPLYTFNSLIEISKMKAISPDEYEKYLEMIQNEVGNTSMLLESLLKWSQNNLNQLQINVKNVSLVDLLTNVITQTKQHSERKHVSIMLDIDDDIYVETDEDLLRFIIRNLTFNAVKFSPENGKVIVSASKKNSGVQIKISDTGVGMSKEQIEAFYQGNMEASIDAVGEKSTGLGLLLVKEFSEKLGVQIEINSQVSQGTTFTLSL
ncbi:MAG: HAMP domain-containing histidine kinase, partial [Schleiferiaceae bacterium]|nr:HAMP domain-containing histidine kinase [Schleiferiaceae bacterium]